MVNVKKVCATCGKALMQHDSTRIVEAATGKQFCSMKCALKDYKEKHSQ